MSWSFYGIGTPDGIERKMREESAKLTGQCKIEFDDAMPHIIGLVRQSFKSDEYAKRYGYPIPQRVKVEASGSGVAENGVQMQRNCTVRIEPFNQTMID